MLLFYFYLLFSSFYLYCIEAFRAKYINNHKKNNCLSFRNAHSITSNIISLLDQYGNETSNNYIADILEKTFQDDENKYKTNIVLDDGNNNLNTTISEKTFEEEIGIQTNAWLKLLDTSTTDITTSVLSPEIPKTNAWQIVKEIIEIDEQPLCSLNEYLLSKSTLPKHHHDKINSYFSKITKYSKFIKISDLVYEALIVSYIGLYEKYMIQNNDSNKWEESMNRAVGISTVLRDFNADDEILLCGLLHDVITIYITENQDSKSKAFYLYYIEKRFSKNVVCLSYNYNKLPKITLNRTDYSMLQNEYQLQMLVVMADEYRTLYLRLADRIHTMRDLKRFKLSTEEKTKIALEARHVYAPLAHKMNLIKYRSELEDVSFSFLQPTEYTACKYTHVQASQQHFNADNAIKSATYNDTYLTSQNMTCTVNIRVKDKYQLYLKMIRQNISKPSDVLDSLGLRVIIDCPKSIGETEGSYLARSYHACYYVLDKIRQLSHWKPDPTFKDYILDVKNNGYQSLHQNIKGISG